MTEWFHAKIWSEQNEKRFFYELERYSPIKRDYYIKEQIYTLLSNPKRQENISGAKKLLFLYFESTKLDEADFWVGVDTYAQIVSLGRDIAYMMFLWRFILEQAPAWFIRTIHCDMEYARYILDGKIVGEYPYLEEMLLDRWERLSGDPLYNSLHGDDLSQTLEYIIALSEYFGKNERKEKCLLFQKDFLGFAPPTPIRDHSLCSEESAKRFMSFFLGNSKFDSKILPDEWKIVENIYLTRFSKKS